MPKTQSEPERELIPGQSQVLLRELHLISRDNKLHADSLRKLKQVNHLARLLAPALDDVLARHPQAHIVDAGAGNAYLGFVLYELFLKSGEAELWNIEPRVDLIARARERAMRLGFSRMRFLQQSLEQAATPPSTSTSPNASTSTNTSTNTSPSTSTSPNTSTSPSTNTSPSTPSDPALPQRLHLVTALHACDTATDDAILLALQRKADHIALVPCCQAEVAAQLKVRAAESTLTASAAGPWSALWQHALHRRELGAHLTNVLRALLLEAHGYAVTVTELTGWEHSMKNELILARRVGGEHRAAKEKLRALLAATGVRPKMVVTLGLEGAAR